MIRDVDTADRAVQAATEAIQAADAFGPIAPPAEMLLWGAIRVLADAVLFLAEPLGDLADDMGIR